MYGSPNDAYVASRIDLLYGLGLRMLLLHRVYQNPFITLLGQSTNHLSTLGKHLIPMLNKKGIAIDTMHMDDSQEADVAAGTNAPIMDSHQWYACGYVPSASRLSSVIATGGGHGIVAVNILGSYYPPAPPAWCSDGFGHTMGGYYTRDVRGLVDTIIDLKNAVGIDHVAIGPDFQPWTDAYTLRPVGGVANIKEAPALTTELLSRPGITPSDVQKIIGGNLRDYYQRVWDPTRGIAPVSAHFRLCSNADSNPAFHPITDPCVAASSNSGQGDFGHRAISCGDPVSGVVGQQLAYRTVLGVPKWMFKNLAGAWVDCSTASQGLTLVISWLQVGESANGRFAIHATSPAYPSQPCDTTCQQASNSGGAGTANARALSCLNPSSNGIVGDKLVYSGGWKFYNLSGQALSCNPNSTFVASWFDGTSNPNAKVRLCDDNSTDTVCMAATTDGGNGTAQVKALNCLKSKADANDFGTVALQVFWQDVWLQDAGGTWVAVPGGGHWQYWDIEAGAPKAYSCVHGSVLVGSSLP